MIVEIIYMLLYVTAAIGRAPFAYKVKKIKPIKTIHKVREYMMMIFTLPAMLLPIIYVFSDWIDAYNINLPLYVIIIGGIGFSLFVALHNWTHIALGINWSPVLDIKKNQELITKGPYKYVRHPMYTAFLGWSLFQGLFLSNWLILTAGFIGFVIFYMVRIKSEENLMIDQFGKEYIKYMKRTGRLFPRF